jgi:acyl carrier protein
MSSFSLAGVLEVLNALGGDERDALCIHWTTLGRRYENMSPTQTQALLSEVRALILEVMEEEEGAVVIQLETRFQADLELESIELIALGDALRARYGERLSVASWLTSLSIEDLMDLKVGDLIEWLEGALEGETGAGAGG